MKKTVDNSTLYNCTATLLQQLDSGLDVKSVWTLNRSELLELLETTFAETENTVKRTAMRDFMSECLFTLQNPYEMVWWQKLVWTVIFASMLVVATGGNTIVMWIVLGKYNMLKSADNSLARPGRKQADLLGGEKELNLDRQTDTFLLLDYEKTFDKEKVAVIHALYNIETFVDNYGRAKDLSASLFKSVCLYGQ
jgi:hypothetical protein